MTTQTQLAVVKPHEMDEYIEGYAEMPSEGHSFRYCPGCGLGIAQGALLRAFEILNLDMDKVVTVGGSGCYAVMGHYFKSSHFHGRHGRAPAVATGIKLAKPELTVITLQGDGDALAIGANHFVQACRRNIDITIVMFNNFVYGETGGQSGATTPKGSLTETTPYGQPENAFDPCALAIGAGATYVARGTVYHAWQLTKLVVNAIQHKGCSFVEVVQNCHELWGKRNDRPKATDMLLWYKENSVQAQSAAKMTPEELQGRWVIGELHKSERPEMVEEYAKVRRQAQDDLRLGTKMKW